MLRVIILFVVLLWSIPAGAAAWKDCVSGAAKGTISAGRDLCTDFATNDLTSDILSVRDCENFDVIYNADDTGTGVLLNDMKVRTCVTNVCSADACNILENITLTGANGASEIYGAAASWICVFGTVDPAGETPRLLLRCNE